MPKQRSPFHRGERQIQERLGTRERTERLGQRMIQAALSLSQRGFLRDQSLLYVGSADRGGRPWASVLIGSPGFLEPLGPSLIRIHARPIYGCPLDGVLVEGAAVGTVSIDFPTRTRLRVNGRVVRVHEAAFDIQLTQGYGNCDMYIRSRELLPSSEPSACDEPREVHRAKTLGGADAALIAGSDTFFIATQFAEGEDQTIGFDMSHRGVPAGTNLVAHESLLLFPDYPGNLMFNTLGNLQVDARAGLLFIDFDSGDTLHLTGEAEVLWEDHHVRRFPGAERVLAFSLAESLRVRHALRLRWTSGKASPRFESFHPVARRQPDADERPAARLTSIQISMPQDILHDGQTVRTGIFKTPVEGRRNLRWLNLDGDGQADLWGHGGAFRAVYVYAKESIEFWRNELGRDELGPGFFGENFCVEGLDDEAVQIGDVFRIGSALVEVSQPRIPCFKLAIKVGIASFQQRFLKAGRTGFYLRVLEEGEVGPGDAIELVARDPNGLSVRRVSDLLFFATDDLEGAHQALSIPALAHGWKGSFEERLAKAAEAAAAKPRVREFLVTRRERESDSITSFYLQPEDDYGLEPFSPGQFLTVELDVPGINTPVVRTYSLSDSPDRDYYRLSIKRELPPSDPPGLPAGAASTFFHDQINEGSRIRVVGTPRGKFQLDLDSNRSVVLLSAGVGLTPLVSMLNAIVAAGAERHVWFIHGARDSREHAMGAHVRHLARQHENVQVHIRYSRPTAEDIEGRDYDSVGRVEVALLKQLLPFDDYEFYLCGPAAFMQSLHAGLTDVGVDASRIHYEHFGPATVLIEPAKPDGAARSKSAAAEVSGTPEVVFARSGVTTVWDPSRQTLLELAEASSLSPPFSCRSGICQTCLCGLLEGDVEYVEEPLQTPDEGTALLCIARPTTRVVLDV